MDIKNLNPVKNKVTLLIKAFNIFYKKETKKSVHDAVSNSGNRLIKSLYDAMDETTKVIDDFAYFKGGSIFTTRKDKADTFKERYRNMIRNPMEFLLSVPNSDSAYQDLFEYAMCLWLRDAVKTDMLSYLEERMKRPEHMYFNAWQDTQRETFEKKDKGELLEGQLSDSEYLLVDDVNKAVLKDYHEKEQSKKKQSSHW